MSNATDFFTSTSFPVPTPLSDNVVNYELSQDASVVKGHVRNGDYYTLPDTTGGSITYHDQSGSIQWTVSKADCEALDSTFNQWCGFGKEDGGVIYAIGVDTTTTPDTYRVFTITEAGVAAFLFNDQPTSDFATAPSWAASSTANGCSRLYYSPETASWEIWSKQSDGGYKLVFDMAAQTMGDVVVNTLHFGAGVGIRAGDYSTIGLIDYTSAGAVIVSLSNRDTYRQWTTPMVDGIPHAANVALSAIDWEDELYLVGTLTSVGNLYGPKRFTRASLAAWRDEILSKYNITNLDILS